MSRSEEGEAKKGSRWAGEKMGEGGGWSGVGRAMRGPGVWVQGSGWGGRPRGLVKLVDIR